MKIKNVLIIGLTLFVGFTNMSAKSKSLSELYKGSKIERSVDESKRNYAPSARENARVFGGESNNEIGIGDILEIIIKNTGKNESDKPVNNNKRVVI